MQWNIQKLDSELVFFGYIGSDTRLARFRSVTINVLFRWLFRFMLPREKHTKLSPERAKNRSHFVHTVHDGVTGSIPFQKPNTSDDYDGSAGTF